MEVTLTAKQQNTNDNCISVDLLKKEYINFENPISLLHIDIDIPCIKGLNFKFKSSKSPKQINSKIPITWLDNIGLPKLIPNQDYNISLKSLNNKIIGYCNTQKRDG